MNKLQYVIIGFILVLFSCEREVLQQSSKVIISLPAGEDSLQSILNPLSTVSIQSDDEKDSDEFNSFIIPTFGSGVTYPVNCYLVAIGAQNSDSNFFRNYCGKRSDETGKIDRNYEFGPYVGLFSNTSTVEIDVPPGDKRIIYVFAIHALNPAACLALSAEGVNNPSRENFSYPYIVGKSATFSVAAGQTSVVPINLNQPVAAERIDGCVISSHNDDDDLVANKIMIERNSFPQNILITGRDGEGGTPTDLRCDYIDVVPKYEYQESGASPQQKPARVGNLKLATISIGGQTQATFSDKVDCEANTSGTQIFSILPLHKKVRRWIRLTDEYNESIYNVSVQTVDGLLLSHSRTFDFRSGTLAGSNELSTGTDYVRAGFDLVIPDHVIAGQCYQMFVVRKSMEDENVTHVSFSTPFSLNSTTPANVGLFAAAGCIGPLVSPTIANNQYFTPVWFRATSPFDLRAVQGSNPFSTQIENSKIYNVKVSTVQNLIPESVSLQAPEVIRRRTNYKCSPIMFRFRNSDKAVIPNPAAGNIEILFSQSEIDANIEFYQNDDCATLAIGPASPMVSISSGSEFKKIYMKTPLITSLGPKTTRFKVFDGTKTYFIKYQFEVTNKND